MKTLADPRVQKFAELVKAGVDAWTRAGQVLCEIKADNASAYEEILAANPDLTREILESFERIGRREVHPSLVLDGSPGARRLALLPYDDQTRLHRAKIMVVVKTSGGHVEREKRVCDLTKSEAQRVIGEDGIRTIAEQRRLLRPRGSGGGAMRMRLDHEPDGPVIDVQAETMTASLDADPKQELQRFLTLANGNLLEARSALVMVGRREHPLDRYIAEALRAVGQLRFAINQGEV